MTQSHCSSDPVPINYSRWHRGTMGRLSASRTPSISKDSSEETVRQVDNKEPTSKSNQESISAHSANAGTNAQIVPNLGHR